MWEILALVVVLGTITWSLIYDDGRFFSILLIGLLIRLAVIPIFPYISGADVADYLPYFSQFSSLVNVNGYLRAIIEFVAPHVKFYTILYPGYIYDIYGASGLTLIRVVNAGLSLLVLPLGNELSKTVFNRRFKRWQAAILLFWPSYVFFSVEVGRTVPTVLFVILVVYMFLRSIEEPSISTLVFFGLAATATIMLRTYYVIYIFGLFLVMYLYKFARRGWKNSYLPVFGLFFTTSIYIGTKIVPVRISLDRINSLAEGIAHGGSAYLTTTYPGSFFDLIWYVPLQGIYFQFSPFVWDVFRISNPLTIIAFLQATLLMIFLVLVGRSIRSNLINWYFVVALMAALVVPFVLGIGVKNAGSAVRWRLPTELIVLSLASTIIDYEYLSNDDC